MMTNRSRVARVRETLLLQHALADANKTSATTRHSLARALELARQRAEAADTLWANGHAAEAYRLAAQAFEATLAAARVASNGAAQATQTPASRVEPALDTTVPAAVQKRSDEARGHDSSAEKVATKGVDGDAHVDSEHIEAGVEVGLPPPLGAGPEAPLRPEPLRSEPLRSEPLRSEPLRSEPLRSESWRSESWRSAFASRGVSPSILAEADELVGDRLLRRPLPEYDDSLTPEHAETFRDAMRVRQRLHDALVPASLTPRALRVKRALRWVALAAAGILAVVALYWMVRTPHEIAATASAYFANSPEFAPSKSIDGDEHSEWLLPDRTTGWLEVSLSPPRAISKVRIKNGHNRHFNDRATRAYELELFDSDGQVVAAEAGEFERLDPESPWAEHAVGGSDISRIRVTVESFHRTGAAIAEIDWGQ